MSEALPEGVGRYELVRRLGAGGMGEVYEARDPLLRRRVALKCLPPGAEGDEESRRRLENEARSAARIVHQNVASLHDVIEEEGRLWLVMELVEGSTLSDLSRPVPMPRLLEIAIQCAAALEAAHRRGVVHGDIKPGNVMLAADGQVKVLDFGVAGMMAAAPDRDRTVTSLWQVPGRAGGTVGYCAPEVLLGRPSDHRADLFSLGVVLHELAGGRHPFEADTAPGVNDRVLHGEPPALPGLAGGGSAALESLLLRLLAKDPARRPADAAELVAELRSIRRRPISGREAGVVPAAGSDPDPRAADDRHGGAPPAAAGRFPGLGRLDVRVMAAAAVVLGILALLLGPPAWRLVTPDRGAAAPVSVVSFDPSTAVIAVLPGSSDDPANRDIEAFSEGLASIVTARLTRIARVHGLQVLPTSLLREFGVDGLESARRELGVTLAVHLDARQVGDGVRVTTSLIDVPGRRQLDADTQVRGLEEVIELEEVVSLRVLAMLRIELEPADREALRTGTDVPRAYDLYVRGRGYLQDYDDPGHVESAIRLFERSVGLDPAFADAHAGLGHALWHRYRQTNEARWVEEATSECRRALELDELTATGHVCLGTVLSGTGRYREAAAEFDHAIALDPDNDGALLGLAAAQEQSGELDPAEATLRRVIALRPTYWAGHNRLGGFLLRRGRFDEAIRAFTEATEMTPDSYRSYSNLGVAYYGAERWDDARRAFTRAIEINPEDELTLSNLGTLEFFEGDYAGSARHFERALELDDSDYWIWGNLADARFWSADRAGAKEAYGRAIVLGGEALEVNPNDARTLRDVALYHAMLGREGPALEHIGRALELAADDVGTQVWAARVFARLHHRDRALEHLRAAFRAGYPRAEVRVDPTFEDLTSDPDFVALVAEGQG